MKKLYFLFPTNYRLAIFFNNTTEKFEIKEIVKQVDENIRTN